MLTRTENRLEALLAEFANVRVLVVGDVMLDKNIYGTVSRVNPEAPVPILSIGRNSKKTMATGGAGNVAKNIAALGGTAVLVSVVGSDAAGQELYQVAKQEGYRALLPYEPGRRTTVKTRFLSQDHRGHHMLRLDEEDVGEISLRAQEQVVRFCKLEAENAHAVLVSDYAKGMLTPYLVRALNELAEKKEGLTLLADVKPAHMLNFPSPHYFLSPNEKEAREYLGCVGGTEPLEDIAKVLTKRTGNNVFLTAAERGMYVCRFQGQTIHVPQTHRVEVADTSGCGDTAAAVILLAMKCGATMEEAAQLANAAGAVVASKVGAVAPTPDEVLEMLRS